MSTRTEDQRLSSQAPETEDHRQRIPRLTGFDPRLRRGRTIGLAGSLILGASALSAGVLPVADRAGQWPSLWLSPTAARVSLLLAYFGLTLLALAWFGLAQVVREGRASGPQLIRVLIEWSGPLVLVPPLYSRDVYSYVVQGAMYRDGLDPYRVSAAGYHSDMAANVSEYWQHSVAPYGPVFLLLAAAVMAVAGSHVILGVLGMRLLMLVALAFTVRWLPVIARRYGVNEASALWLGALNPLVLAHVVSGAHNDALLVTMLLAGMLLAMHGRPVSASVLITVAVLIKASAVVALIFVIPAAARMLRGRWTLVRGGLIVAAVAAVTMSVITALTDAWYGWVVALGDTARVHNGLSISTDIGIFVGWLGKVAAVPQTVDAVTVARMAGLAVAAGVLLLILNRTRSKPVYGLGLALTTIVVLGPVVHPWYLLWGFVPLAATARDPRVIRLVALASLLMAFYPMPSGGGPSAELALGSIGILVGVLAYLAWPRPTAATATATAGTLESEPTQANLLLDHLR